MSTDKILAIIAVIVEAILKIVGIVTRGLRNIFGKVKK